MYAKSVLVSALAAIGIASAQSIDAAQSSALVNAFSSYYGAVFANPAATSALAALETNTAVIAQLSGLIGGDAAQATNTAALASVNSVIDILPSDQASVLHSIIAGEVSIVNSVLSTTAAVANPTTTYIVSSGTSSGAAVTLSGSSRMTTSTSTGTSTTAAAGSSTRTSGTAAATATTAGAPALKAAGLLAGVFGAAVAML